MTDRMELTTFDRALLMLVALLLTLLGGFIVFAVVAGGPNHSDIIEEFGQNQDQLTYISCLLEIPLDDRTPAAVAGCQLP